VIPGGWFKTVMPARQHWRLHGHSQSVCAKAVVVGGGSLLPYEGVPACAECRRQFISEAILALPKYRRIVTALQAEIDKC
jgi:hypothetical protein